MSTVQQKQIELPVHGSKDQETNEILSSLVMNGDMAMLSSAQKLTYYKQVCDKLGLDPLSQPFKLLKLDGKEILYCHRGGAQQLNKLHHVSHCIQARETVNDCYVVTAQAATPDGRKTESIGAVSIHNLSGEALCNAMMKAETKAKRRATLDLLGLGMMDETEIPNNAVAKELSIEPKQTSKAYPESLFMSNDGLSKAVSNCTDEEHLLQLYHENRGRIERHPELKQLFTERKNALRSKAAA